MKGGQLETIMGQYFRQWLEDEGLIAANYVPEIGEMRFYANSYQRTIATARYFASGMLPMANIRVERHLALNERDAVFLPKTPSLIPGTSMISSIHEKSPLASLKATIAAALESPMPGRVFSSSMPALLISTGFSSKKSSAK